MKDDADVRPAEEAAASIEAFTPAQWVRLEQVSRRYAWLYPRGAEALLWEAIGRAVAGTRRCPAAVHIVKFLADAMKSIADGEANRAENKASHTLFHETGVDVADAVQSLYRPQNPEEMMINIEEAANLRETVLNLFADDPQARDLADGIMADCEGEELRALTDLDKTAFASKRRLVRRRLTKARAEGII